MMAKGRYSAFINRSFLLGGFVCCIVLGAQAQTIKGRVLDSKTLEGLPFANVFLNSTSIGCVTDENGSFSLTVNDLSGKFEIVFSFVGYWSYKASVTVGQDNLDLGMVKLIPSEVELGSVEVSGKRDKEWEKKLKKFKKVFLGEDKQALSCAILNPWVIDFPKSSSSTTLMAKASVPIEIENSALGYKVFYYLSNLWENKNGYLISGNARFEKMRSSDPKEILKWDKNRFRAYLHSTHHLFKSMIQNRIKAEGFNLYTETKGHQNATTRSSSFYSELGKTIEPCDTAKLVVADAQPRYYRIFIPQKLEVHYIKDRGNRTFYEDVSGLVSWISLKSPSILVDSNGFPKKPSDIVVSGDLSSDRVARMLPLDYSPDILNYEIGKEDLAFFQERVYIHTDKPYYYPKETVWFKGYINYNKLGWRDSLSHTIYVELLNRKSKNILLSKIVRIDSGFFYNNFVIPDSIENGNYYLRAYTNLVRNFGNTKLYVKPILILPLGETIVKDSTQTLLASPDSLFSVQSSKPIYKTHEEISLNFELKDEEGTPLKSNFSISVTNMNQVVPIEQVGNILSDFSMKDFSSEPKDSKTKLEFAVEHGISFTGRYLDENKKPVNDMLEVIQFDPSNFAMTKSDVEGKFLVNGLVFYDTASFLIQPVSGKKRGKAGSTEIIKREPAPIDFEEINFGNYETRKNSFLHNNSDGSSLLNTTVLNQVVVHRSKIVQEQPIDRVNRPYGKPDYVLNKKDINSSYGSLLQALPGKFPGLTVRQGSNPDGGLEWFVYIEKGGASSSALNVKQVLVTINDIIFEGKPELIISAIDPNTVESVEVTTRVNVLYGSLGGNGIVAIYTKKNSDPSLQNNQDKAKDVSLVKVEGYSKPEKFSFPSYRNIQVDKEKKDYRATIYWNPEIKTSSKGVATVSFFAAELPAKYKVVAEGVNQNGDPIRCVYLLEVVN